MGSTLTASPGTIADADGLTSVSYSWEWFRSGNPVPVWTSASYTPVAADVGQTLTVRASFTDDAGNEVSRTSAGTDTVAAAENRPATGAPSISGTAQVGETLTADAGTIADADGLENVSYRWQWVRVEADGAERDIAGATMTRYAVVEADMDRRLRVRASFADDAGHEESRTSAARDTVAGAIPVPALPQAGGLLLALLLLAVGAWRVRSARSGLLRITDAGQRP